MTRATVIPDLIEAAMAHDAARTELIALECQLDGRKHATVMCAFTKLQTSIISYAMAKVADAIRGALSEGAVLTAREQMDVYNAALTQVETVIPIAAGAVSALRVELDKVGPPA